MPRNVAFGLPRHPVDKAGVWAANLAGLIADDAKMTKRDLEGWVKVAEPGALAGSTVAWVAAGNPAGWDLAMKWIDSKEAHIAEAGWSTLSHLVATRPDDELNLEELKRLVVRVEKTIAGAPDRARYAMNGFIIALGSYVPALTALALAAGERIGHVKADLGNNSCQIPFAPDYIRKVQERGAIGKKRKTAKC